ncbi:hypothetical protein ACIP4W_40270 [Streptomyces sp. NPDC088846]|uniref:hypothetical protein n=1 Tax=Streptomyces sp. NPDC088846 TaxID=3365908 RepID=UPI0038188612
MTPAATGLVALMWALAPAAAATYALRYTPTDTTLRAARERAIRAADDLVAAAGTAIAV